MPEARLLPLFAVAARARAALAAGGCGILRAPGGPAARDVTSG